MPLSPCALKSVIHSQLCAALLILPGMATAQVEQQQQAPQTQQAQNPHHWAQYNRFVELAAGKHQQTYREQDPSGQTADGILNSETGNQDALRTTVRWQSESHWLVQFQANRQSGVTRYNGYLQSSSGILTPYRARTGNTATQLSATVGYALNASNWAVMPTDWQLTPLLQYGHHHWQRNLVQYGESYKHPRYALGALLQWQARRGTVLEVQALSGRVRTATVNVPSLGFKASQPGGHWHQWQLGISQDLAVLTGRPAFNGWRLSARYARSQYGHAASPVVNSLQAPPNTHSPSAWALGLQKQY